ncbi:hypothetical protein HK101_001445 [Irineochytrium annulatum]|nr:hypothetical protein HK101_001445 [Irineochytrium annulatum]
MYRFFIRRPKKALAPPPPLLPDSASTLAIYPPKTFDPKASRMPTYELQFLPPANVSAPTQLYASAPVPVASSSMASQATHVTPPMSTVTYDSNDPTRPTSYIFDVEPDASEPAPPRYIDTFLPGASTTLSRAPRDAKGPIVGGSKTRYDDADARASAPIVELGRMAFVASDSSGVPSPAIRDGSEASADASASSETARAAGLAPPPRRFM